MLEGIIEAASDLCDVVAIAHSLPKPPDHASSLCDIVCMPDFPAIDRLLRNMFSPAASYLPDPSQPSMSAESSPSRPSIFDPASVSAARPVWPGQGVAREAVPCMMDVSTSIIPPKPQGQLSPSPPPADLPIPSLSTPSEATEYSQPACDNVTCLHARQQQTLKVAHLQRQLGEIFTQEADKTDSKAELLAKDFENKTLKARNLELDQLFNDVSVELAEAQKERNTLKEDLAQANKALENEKGRLEEVKKVSKEELEDEQDRSESVKISLQKRIDEEKRGRAADRLTSKSEVATLKKDLTQEGSRVRMLRTTVDNQAARINERDSLLLDRQNAVEHQQKRNKSLFEENKRFRDSCKGKDNEIKKQADTIDKMKKEAASQQLAIADMQTKSSQSQQDLEAKAVQLQEKDVKIFKFAEGITTLTSENHGLKMITCQFYTNLKGLTNMCENSPNFFTKHEEGISPKEQVDDKMTELEVKARAIDRSHGLEPGEVEEPSSKKRKLNA